jgi:hypothetical protein
LAKWQVRGLLIGPEPPRGTVKLGRSFTIQRITEQQRRDYLDRATHLLANHEAAARAQFGELDTFSTTPPLEKLVYSKHEARITVTAVNPALAILQAIEDSGKYLGALAIVVGTQRFQFSPLVARQLAGSGEVNRTEHTMTTMATATVYHPVDITQTTVNEVNSFLAAASSDTTAQTAFGFLTSAWRLDDMGRFDPAAQKAILSNCFLVLETIANAITKEWRKQHNDDIVSEYAIIVKDLEGRLHEIQTVSEKVTAIRNADEQLKRAMRNFQNLKLETAGRRLGVSEEHIEAAQQLYKVRNSISHPDSSPDESVKRWIFADNRPVEANDDVSFGDAELTAMAFLKAYASSLTAR